MRRTDTNAADEAVTAIEVKAIEWLERAAPERDAARGFVGELVLSLVAECREDGDDAEDTIATVVSTLSAFAEAAHDFTADDIVVEIPDA